MSDTFKVGDRVRWVGDDGNTWNDNWSRPGDVGTVVHLYADGMWVRVDRTGKKQAWGLENTAALTSAPDTITIDTLTLTLDQARRAGTAAAQADAHKAAAKDRIVAIRFSGVEAIRVPVEQVRRALENNLQGDYLYLWEQAGVAAHNGTNSDTLLLDTPELFERLRG